jgi:hypothetical protein
MAVYLDANVLCRWARVGLEAAALRLVATYELRQPLLVPSLAISEAEHFHRRQVERLLKERRDADRHLSAYLETPLGQVDLNVDDVIARWRAAVVARVQTIEVSGEHAAEALTREVLRRAPAREGADGSGEGARDAAIWVAVLRNHVDAERPEPSHFISADKHFNKAHVQRELLNELPDGAPPFHFHGSVAGFLRSTGHEQVHGAERVPDDEIRERVIRLANVVVEPSNLIPSAIFGFDHRYWYSSQLHGLEFLGSGDQWRFVAPEGDTVLDGSRAFTLVESRWRIEADCYRWPADSDPSNAEGVEGAVLEGTLQVFLPEDPEGAPQLAQMAGWDVRRVDS